MRILFVGNLELGEVMDTSSIVGYEIFKHILEQEDEVYFFSYFQDGEKYSRYKKLFGKRNISNNIVMLGIFPFLYRVLKFKPNIVQITSPSVYYLLAFPIFKFLKTEIFYLVHSVNYFTIDRFTFQGRFEKARTLFIEKTVVIFASIILVLSKLEKEHILNSYNISSKKIFIVENGFNKFNKSKNYSSQSDKIKIVTFGALDRKEKGLNYLILLLGEMNDLIELTVLNNKKHSSIEYEFPKNISIIWKEPLNEVKLRKELISHDFFLLFSEYESFSISLLEAMNSGLLFLVTDRIGLTERFDENLKEFVFPFGEWEHAKEKLEDLTKLPIERKQKLSKQIIKFSNKYTWDKVVEKYFELYKTLIK